MVLPLSQLITAGHRFPIFGALRHRNFRWFLIGTIWQATGQGMQFLILGWLVLRITESSSQMGLVIFIFGVPNFALLLSGGIVADRLDRRRLLVTTQSVVAVAILLLAMVEIADLVALWHLYIVAFFLGIVQGLNMPARLAIVADLVDRNDMMNAVALTSAVMNIGRIVGPALAGWIIDAAGIGPSLIFNAGCYVLGTLLLGLVQAGPTPRIAGPRTVLGDLAQGVNYFRSTAVAFSIIGMGMAFGLFAMAYLQVLPAFVKEFLETSASGAGLLISAAGLGSLLGSLALASLGDAPNKGRLLLGTAMTFIAALFLFAWSPWFWASWVVASVRRRGKHGVHLPGDHPAAADGPYPAARPCPEPVAAGRRAELHRRVAPGRGRRRRQLARRHRWRVGAVPAGSPVAGRTTDLPAPPERLAGSRTSLQRGRV